MKTKTNTHSFFATIRLPEIITWIIGLLVFMVMIFSLNLSAQGTAKKHIPDVPIEPKIFIAFGGGWPGNVGMSLNFLSRKDMGGSISFKYRYLESENRPRDYHGGMFSLFTPGDEVTMVSACFVKVFPVKTTKRVRIGVEGGLSLITYSEANFTHTSSYWFFGPNYDVTYTKKNTAGLTFRTKVEFPFSQVVGLELAFLGNINTIKPFFGLELYLTLGRIRDRIKPRK